MKKTEDNPYIEEIIKATYITEDNLEIIKNLSLTNDFNSSLIDLGKWLISLTVRVESIFTPGVSAMSEQMFWIVDSPNLHDYLEIRGEAKGILKSFDAERRPVSNIPTPFQNTEVKEQLMACGPLTTSYILYMIDNHGSRTYQVLMDYGRASKDVLTAFQQVIKEGYLEHGSNPKKPYLTQAGRDHLRDYYGNGIESYD